MNTFYSSYYKIYFTVKSPTAKYLEQFENDCLRYVLSTLSPTT